MFGSKLKGRGGEYSKALKSPFGAFRCWMPNDKAAQRFSVYLIPTYHDKNMIRDNATGKLMCFADGDAIAFPDAWIPDDHPAKGTSIDPEANPELDVYVVCDRLNADPSLASHYVWGRGYPVGRFRLIRLGGALVLYPGLIAMAWWLAGLWRTTFTVEHPYLTIGAIWFGLAQVWGVLVMILSVAAGLHDQKQAAAA